MKLIAKKQAQFAILSVCILLLICVIIGSIYLIPYIYLNRERIIFNYGVVYLYRWGRWEQFDLGDIYPLRAEMSPNRKTVALTYLLGGRDVNKTEQFIGVLDIKTHKLSSLFRIEKPDNFPAIDGSKWQKVQIAWSPDGKKLLFNMLSPQNYPQLYLLDVETNILNPTSLVFNDTVDKKNVSVDDINWSPGPVAIVTVCFVNAHDLKQCELLSVDDEFANTTFLLDKVFGARWLSDGKTIVYSCYEESETVQPQFTRVPKGLCSYSFQTKTIKLISMEMKIAEWSSDGLFAFEWRGGAEGDPAYLMVYNANLNRIYRLPNWFTP